MRRILITAALVAATITTAYAGSNVCEGTVQVGKEWTTVKVSSVTTRRMAVGF